MSPQLVEKKKRLEGDMESILRREDIFWSQKAKCKWLKEGDGNTKYFHKVANDRKIKNTISSLYIQGQMENEFDKIKDEATRYFTSLYKNDGRDKPRILNLFSSQIDNVVACNLEKPFSVEKVKKASMEKDKSSGPDGFSMFFYQKCWDIMWILWKCLLNFLIME